MPTNKLVGQAEREREKEKIHDCAYLIPKHLLLPENQRNNTRSLSNYDIVSGGLNATIYQDPEEKRMGCKTVARTFLHCFETAPINIGIGKNKTKRSNSSVY